MGLIGIALLQTIGFRSKPAIFLRFAIDAKMAAPI
jgi:hypothetical protein